MDMDIQGVENEAFGSLVKQGAEARVFKSTFVGRLSIVKQRFSKKYRHPLLDAKLTVKRLNMEVRCMTKARRLGIPTPVLYAVDPILHTQTFEYVDGLSVKEILLDFGSNGIVEEQLDDIAIQIGTAMGKMHDGGLIHGDLTTSNMIIRRETNQLVLIDFGLSFTSTLPEDKAVDLYVLERALLSMHSSCGNVRLVDNYPRGNRELRGSFFNIHGPKDTICWFSDHGVKLKFRQKTMEEFYPIIYCRLPSQRSKRGMEID